MPRQKHRVPPGWTQGKLGLLDRPGIIALFWLSCSLLQDSHRGRTVSGHGSFRAGFLLWESDGETRGAADDNFKLQRPPRATADPGRTEA